MGAEDATKFSHSSGSAALSLESISFQPCSSGRKYTLLLQGFSKCMKKQLSFCAVHSFNVSSKVIGTDYLPQHLHLLFLKTA